MLRDKLFRTVRSILPKISETERIALRSGGVGIDRDIFAGRVDRSRPELVPKPQTADDTRLLDKTDALLRFVGSDNIYPGPRIREILERIGKDGYLGMIIDPEHGGSRVSISAQSRILTRIASHNPGLGVAVMVPNSLGPAELLSHYGTEEQKRYFLPRLADGRMIPCFGLTGPHNGSDATGRIDRGEVVLVDGVPRISVRLDKRYITLAPVAGLVGVAFHLADPHRLLPAGREGVTVALLERDHPGLRLDTRHNPNNAGFPNGTVRGDVLIGLDQIIGGPSRAGDGWLMLMECLAVGRGVSLPASANATAKTVTYGLAHYLRHREQFRMPIGDMEAVREKFVRMFCNAWVINASVHMTNTILDHGRVPSVLTAVMKQQTTERARAVLQDGMDLYAGSALCVGENNFFTRFYHSAPVGITVEGSNTLTRGLIIFGQGLNKSHPHIHEIVDCLYSDDRDGFGRHFDAMLTMVVRNYAAGLPSFRGDRLRTLTLRFSTVANFIALLGGKIKSRQMMSGDMADALSAVYLAEAVLWYHTRVMTGTEGAEAVRDYCVRMLCDEAEAALTRVIDNYPGALRALLLPFRYRAVSPSYEDKNRLYRLLLGRPALVRELRKDIFVCPFLEKLETLSSLDRTSPEYRALYEEVIRVGEHGVS